MVAIVTFTSVASFLLDLLCLVVIGSVQVVARSL